MIKVIEEHIDEESITFDIHGKEIKLNFLESKEIEERLFDIHFKKFIKDRSASSRGKTHERENNR